MSFHNTQIFPNEVADFLILVYTSRPDSGLALLTDDRSDQNTH